MRGESDLATGEQPQVVWPLRMNASAPELLETTCMKSTKILERHGFFG